MFHELTQICFSRRGASFVLLPLFRLSSSSSSSQNCGFPLLPHAHPEHFQCAGQDRRVERTSTLSRLCNSVCLLPRLPPLSFFLTTWHKTSLLSDSSDDDLASSLFLRIFPSETFLPSAISFPPDLPCRQGGLWSFLSLLFASSGFRSFLRSMRLSSQTSGLQELRNRPYLLHRDHLGHLQGRSSVLSPSAVTDIPGISPFAWFFLPSRSSESRKYLTSPILFLQLNRVPPILPWRIPL